MIKSFIVSRTLNYVIIDFKKHLEMLPKTRKLSALESVIWYSLFALLVITSFLC